MNGQQMVPEPVRIVHLRRDEYGDAAARARWQRMGYATLGPMEGHDPHQRCPVCSTDNPEVVWCEACGGPCPLLTLARAMGLQYQGLLISWCQHRHRGAHHERHREPPGARPGS